MSTMRRHIMTLVITTFVIAGCSQDFDYQYMSFARNMEVVKYGRTELPDMRNHGDMPTRFRRDQEQYIPYALVDTISNLPAIIISIESNTQDSFQIAADGIHCFLFYDGIRPNEYQRHGYLPGSLRFFWSEINPPPCDRVKVPTPDERVIKLSVLNNNNGRVAEEQLRFDILSNGIRRVYDSL